MDDTWSLGVVSLEPWDRIWRRNQHLVDRLLALSPGLTVAFVTPPADPLHAAMSGRAPRAGAGAQAVEGYGGRLSTFQPTKWLPGALGAASDRGLDRAIARHLRRGRGVDALWINDPRRAGVARLLEVPTLYDVTDDWTEARRSPRERARLVRGDAWLTRHAGAVVVCSPALQASKGGTLIRNAVDVVAYREPRPRPHDLPRRAALYCGTLHEDRLDVDLVIATGARLAESGAVLALLGPVALTETNGRRLLRAPGVVVLGARGFEDVPAYLQHADALVVPHLVDDFTATLDPIKLYEYLAVGRPIVSTPCAGFVDAGEEAWVTVAPRDGFADAVTASVGSTHGPSDPADVADWSDRAKQMLEVLDGLPRSAGVGPGAAP
ncbi:glycosyltransferase [Demequina muriae]|uniref:Glycosyltransferase n=1 Tax=Demequina muriae TaxID=3051664 RepID=A0ABT8GK75_9MICO|nr:glycosyltransferase [Demequina sp. EGI L300058]MDN4481764.1 glycosyltransferase [Demequina sp. EGI L300058]